MDNSFDISLEVAVFSDDSLLYVRLWMKIYAILRTKIILYIRFSSMDGIATEKNLLTLH